MGLITAQQLNNYYDIYRDRDVAFTKEIVKTLNLDTRQIYIKCGGEQWPCILNTSSLLGAKVIIGRNGGAYAAMQENNAVSLRFSFVPPEAQPISFFVNARVGEIVPYMDTNDLMVVALEFSQRAPDDLIEILGGLLEANVNAVRRREERISVTADSKRKIGLQKEETVVYVQNIPRHCILRDISFSGCKIILVGLKQLLIKQIVMIRFEFDDPRETIHIRGVIVGGDEIEGRKDLVVANIVFDEKNLPMAYKLRINTYISNVRKNQLDSMNVSGS